MIRILIFVVAICSILTTHAATTGLDKVIVVVNDEPIMLSEYRTRHKREQLRFSQQVGSVPAEIDSEVLEALIGERLQAQVAAARQITVGDQEVEQMLSNLGAQNNLSRQQLFEELEAQGIAPGEFQRSLAEQQLVRKVIDIAVNSRVTISEQEIDYHIQAHRDLYARNESYEISHLLISVADKSATEIEQIEGTANDIRQSLASGLAFADVLRNNPDAGSPENVEYLGWRKEAQLPELFVDALRKTRVGGYSDVLKSANGFHILQLHAKDGDLQIVSQQLLRHILVHPARRNLTDQEAIAVLTGIRQELAQGADFSQLARLNSDDPESAPEGGLLGWVNPGEVDPRIEQQALALELNQVSEPVKSVFGYHLIEVLDRRERDISHDLVRKAAQRELFKRKAAELYKFWFDQLRADAHIEYMVDVAGK